MTTLYMTRGDLKPSIEATLKYLDGTTVDLTDASGVVFNMKKENGPVIISGKAGSIIEGSAPEVKPSIVRYDWEEGDTDVVGVCLGEFVVTFSEVPAEEGSEGSSKELTFPPRAILKSAFENDKQPSLSLFGILLRNELLTLNKAKGYILSNKV